MTGKPKQQPTYSDLEPVLYKLKRSIRLLIVILEEGLIGTDGRVDPDDSESVSHAVYNVRAHADEALGIWIEAQAADSQKAAA